MALDGIVLRAISFELNEKLLGGRIDKVYQPERDEIIVLIRNKGHNYKLLVSASSNNPRIHLTETTKSNPETPPMFCMLLRKHLQGGRIVNIEQVLLERILKIEIQNLDELGNISIKQLTVEIMGRHSNIILIDKSSNKIIDSIKRITPDISTVRQILPGLIYNLPPSQEKINPLDINKDIFFSSMDNTNDGTPVYKFFYKTYMGLSPLIAREICHRTDLNNSTLIGQLDENDKEQLFNSFKKIIEMVQKNQYTPNIVLDENSSKLLGFSVIDIQQYGSFPKKNYSEISNVLEEFYYKRDHLDRLKQKSSNLKKVITNKLERSINKLAKQKEELINAEKREKYKIYGDLLTANLYRIDKSNQVELENFYSENIEKVVIKLDPRLSPAQNAQKYYKKYNKLKNAHEVVAEQIKKTKEEVEYLENVLLSIENCTTIEELEEIREELSKEGYIKLNRKNKNKKEALSQPKHYISTDGFHIYVGKNNKQNDYLTIKFAGKNDIWLHTKDIPGSHVIIKTEGKEVPESTVLQGAMLAAFYSKGNMSSNVPVDYTEKKNVKKPNGAKPGMVIYENYKTIYVTPKNEDINKITKVED